VSSADDSEFFFELPEHEEYAADYIAEIGRELQLAFMARKKECGLTQQAVAKMLGINRSQVHRCLSGHANLTADTIGQLAWALRARPRFKLELEEISGAKGLNNYSVWDPAQLHQAKPKVTTEQVVKVATGKQYITVFDLPGRLAVSGNQK
jgi:plasmid maintenance system antidote protein VapI